MILIFPKSWRTALDANPPKTQVGIFRQVAPFPHAAPPTGGFIVEKYPKMLLIYMQEHGIAEVRNTRYSPFDKEFDFDDYSIRYLIETSDGKPLFVCR
jgi:hypothetical protein